MSSSSYWLVGRFDIILKYAQHAMAITRLTLSTCFLFLPVAVWGIWPTVSIYRSVGCFPSLKIFRRTSLILELLIISLIDIYRLFGLDQTRRQLSWVHSLKGDYSQNCFLSLLDMVLDSTLPMFCYCWHNWTCQPYHSAIGILRRKWCHWRKRWFFLLFGRSCSPLAYATGMRPTGTEGSLCEHARHCLGGIIFDRFH
jgi:hypothetical protein